MYLSSSSRKPLLYSGLAERVSATQRWLRRGGAIDMREKESQEPFQLKRRKAGAKGPRGAEGSNLDLSRNSSISQTGGTRQLRHPHRQQLSQQGSDLPILHHHHPTLLSLSTASYPPFLNRAEATS